LGGQDGRGFAADDVARLDGVAHFLSDAWRSHGHLLVPRVYDEILDHRFVHGNEFARSGLVIPPVSRTFSARTRSSGPVTLVTSPVPASRPPHGPCPASARRRGCWIGPRPPVDSRTRRPRERSRTCCTSWRSRWLPWDTDRTTCWSWRRPECASSARRNPGCRTPSSGAGGARRSWSTT